MFVGTVSAQIRAGIWGVGVGLQPPGAGQGCQPAWGVFQGSCVPGPGASQGADTVLRVWHLQQQLETSLLCRTGAGGQQLLSQGLMLWDTPGPSFSVSGDPTMAVGRVLSPVCHCWRTAQLQPCGAPADSRGSAPASSQGRRWSLGPHPPLSQGTVAGGEAQHWYRGH